MLRAAIEVAGEGEEELSEDPMPEHGHLPRGPDGLAESRRV